MMIFMMMISEDMATILCILAKTKLHIDEMPKMSYNISILAKTRWKL